MKIKNLIRVGVLGLTLAGFSLSAVSADLYSQSGSDPSWNVVKNSGKIPQGKNSNNGYTGSVINVNNKVVEVGPNANRSIDKDITIHTVGNSVIKRNSFGKWSRWYQEDGNTQVFRLFKDEENRRNSRKAAARIEAASQKTFKKGGWHEFHATYTIVKPINCMIFQSKAPDLDWGLSIHMDVNGNVKMQRRRGKSEVIGNNMVGKPFHVRARDNGKDYELYVNGKFIGKGTWDRKNLSSRFRWGCYMGASIPKKDGMLFVTGATVDPKTNPPVVSPPAPLDPPAAPEPPKAPQPTQSPFPGGADQCDNTAQCRTLFGNAATDCKDSRSNNSVCMCGNNVCGPAATLAPTSTATPTATPTPRPTSTPNPTQAPFPSDGDQCDNTAQCRSMFGSSATDCKDSRSDNSVCMCGNNACSSNAIANPTASPQPTSTPNPQQTAYADHAIPGRIEAENFDEGSNGKAYSDLSSANSGFDYRDTDVDIQLTEDSDGAYNVGWIQGDEWLEYTISDVEAGVYDIKVRVAANPDGNKSISFALGGKALGEVSFGATGGWQSWETLTLKGVKVDGGENKVLRLTMGGGRFNVNWVEFVDADGVSDVAPTPAPSPSVGNRIAVTSDGNAHDRDDICATGMTLGLLARNGAGDQLVHYTLNDHIWKPDHKNNWQQEHNKTYDEVMGLLGGRFPNVKKFDAFNNTSAAVNDLVSEINRSSASSKLTVIMSGRAEIIGQAVQKADKSKLKHVTVITHSSRNNTHGEEFHNGVKWSVVQNSGANVKQIRNQNADTKKAYSQYSSLNTNSDALKKKIWDRCNAMGVSTFDPSDAGMVYYHLFGDEKANPSKLIKALGSGGSDNPGNSGSELSGGDYEDDNGLIVMEAENTPSNLDLWEVRTSVGGYTGSAYLEFTGNKASNGPATSPLTYTFKVNKAGLYYLDMHVARETIGDRTDVANDAFVRLEGDYNAHPNAADKNGSPATKTVLSKNTKFYGGADKQFVWSKGAALDPGGKANKRIAVYQLKAGKTYKLVVSGRSKFFKMDRIVFRHESRSANDAHRLSLQETR